MITAEAAHSIAIKVRDGHDSDASTLLKKIDEIVTTRARLGMYWAYIQYDVIMPGLSEQEFKWVRHQLERLGYSVSNYSEGCWGIAW